jgi:hypothetical protein
MGRFGAAAACRPGRETPRSAQAPALPPNGLHLEIRREKVISAKIGRFFTYLQGVLRNCPSAPFSLDRP